MNKTDQVPAFVEMPLQAGKTNNKHRNNIISVVVKRYEKVINRKPGKLLCIGRQGNLLQGGDN